SALLLQGKKHVIGENVAGESIESLYRLFLETCDVNLGFKLIPDAYPEWIKVTRPYYRGSYVLAVANTGWRSLADVPKSQAVGAAVLANESVLRSNVDQAIASLIADGTIQRILDDNKFPATAPK